MWVREIQTLTRGFSCNSRNLERKAEPGPAPTVWDADICSGILTTVPNANPQCYIILNAILMGVFYLV